LWFGTPAQLADFGPPLGFGGVWLGDHVNAGEPSDPFWVAGYAHRCVHLSTATDAKVVFTLQIDAAGTGEWTDFKRVTVAPHGYQYEILPRDLRAEWLRVVADKPCHASAYFQLRAPNSHDAAQAELFAGLAKPEEVGSAAWTSGLLRPAAHNRDLMLLSTMRTAAGDAERRAEVAKLCAVEPVFEVDDASVIVRHGEQRLRLPKGHLLFDAPPAPLRAERECVSERTLANIHGTFYEVPRAETAAKEDLNWYKLKPVATHNRLITDYCTWRGLFVIAGVRADAQGTPNLFRANDASDSAGLWFGSIDDLWKLGKPVGVGGPWKQAAVKAGEASDPYLMTGYDHKRVALSHDSDAAVTFRVEVDVYNRGVWKLYKEFTVPAGELMEHSFDASFVAHWVRVVADRDCQATATFVYE
jgi:hypothetical protein